VRQGASNYSAHIAHGNHSKDNGLMDPPKDKKPVKPDEKVPRCEEELSLGHRCCLPLGHDGLHLWKSPDGREFSWG
jgi:hypothetical protein